MEEEILFYGAISNFSVASFIQRLNAAKKLRQNINVLANSMGGDADAGYGMITSLRNFPFAKKLTVHGAAYSMMAFSALYVAQVEAIEQAQFLFHRAASFFEEDETVQALLRKRNEDLRKAMEEKLDIDAFERISGVTLDQLFDPANRIDVVLTAPQAQEINLVTRVIPLSADEAERINTRMIAASQGHGIQPISIPQNSKNTMNTIEEFKSQHPDLYSQVLALGAKKASEVAMKAEKDRIQTWLAWKDVDAKAVFEGIDSGEPLSQAKTQEFIQAGMKNGFVASLEQQSTKVGGQSGDEKEDKKSDDLPEELNTMAANVTQHFKNKYQKAS